MNVKNDLETYNKVIYDEMKNLVLSDGKVVLLQVDGTSRESVVLKLISDYKDEIIKCFVFDNCTFKDDVLSNYDFLNIEFINYKDFLNMSRDQIIDMDVSFVIFDSCYFTRFPEIDFRINMLIDTHADLKILGIDNFLIKDSFDKGVISSFNKVIYGLDDAFVDSLFKFPKYITMVKELKFLVNDLYEKIKKRSLNSKDYDNYLAILYGLKSKVSDIDFYGEVKSVLGTGKYLYLCNDEDECFIELNNLEGVSVFKSSNVDEFISSDGCSILISSEKIFIDNLDGIILGSYFDNFLLEFSFIMSFYKDVIDKDFIVLDLFNNIKDVKFLIDSILRKNNDIILDFDIKNKDIIEMVDYVKGFYNNKRLSYFERCTEFLEFVEKNDFSELINVNFSDNVNMESWWDENRKKILKDDEIVCKKITKIYKKKETLGFEDKKRAFLEYIRDNKVPKIKDDVRFFDEINMGAWWLSNKKNIFKLDDDVSLDIINIIKDRYGDDYE